MSRIIKVTGQEGTHEYQAGLDLKKIFEEQIPTEVEDFNLIIATNLTLFGQEVKDIDIVVIGQFGKGFVRKLKFKPKDREEYVNRNVYFSNFCFVIELKNHHKEDVSLGNTGNLLVKYNGRDHDVTYQSNKQKYSLLRYFKNFDEIGYSPYIVNLIWLKNVSAQDLNQMTGRKPHNYLPSNFKIDWLLQLACSENTPYESGLSLEGKVPFFAFSSGVRRENGYDLDNFDKAFQLFNVVKNNAGNITRQHFERLTKKILTGQKYADAILNTDQNGKFVIFSGRAGTGKTVKLLTVASDLCVNYGFRCLILTFNFALVADLRRTLTLAGIPDSAGQESVRIITLHKFFIDLLEGFEIFDRSSIPDDNTFFQKYPEYCQSLIEFIEAKKALGSPLEMAKNQQAIDWDYVFIDEAQDWLDEEIDILYKIFGPSRVVIARASDQMTRSGKSAKWVRPRWKPNIDYVQTNERKSFRQKVNLVHFANMFAEKFGLPGWELEPNDGFVGGKIIVTSTYTYELHQEQYELCKKNGNKAYEMMFIVPNTLIVRREEEIHSSSNGDGSETKKIVKLSSCSLVKEYEGKIDFWDGTNKDLRREYPVKIDQHRIVPYEACRGLEGWTVVCMNLDEFVSAKAKAYKNEDDSDQLSIALETEDEKREKFVNQWTLIPFTRAIDTLIIVLKDMNSPFSKKLKEVCRELPEIVEWME
ncbi:DNA or RNA helicase [Dyadobacter endophyticus]|uniref:DNA or RNA helicase n=1 Tax=Dyadobacter endophyticus TaxID=1749036 RepID=A0ABQ1YTS2_9BACT|nr:AAA family ATPase [Dyadobacter endophyticus]GGH36798.1 DNA or RNA helicase [Dyadobacter endophyticus]